MTLNNNVLILIRLSLKKKAICLSNIFIFSRSLRKDETKPCVVWESNYSSASEKDQTFIEWGIFSPQSSEKLQYTPRDLKLTCQTSFFQY